MFQPDYYVTPTKNTTTPITQTNSITTPTKNTTTPTSSKIAFLPPSFTLAAYQKDISGHYVKFYGFYAKYGNIHKGVNVTTDLENLTTHVTGGGHEYEIKIYSNWIKTVFPNVTISTVNEQDVHDGRIFLDDGSNAFGTIIIFHEEYVTQQMYDNFKRFVSNGGTLLFLDGNVFYAEVKYNQASNSITLVKGHGWQFDGTVAQRSIWERWLSETSQWMGSNYWEKPIHDPVLFANSPFNWPGNPYNYTHMEENYVNNPNDIILYNYNAINKNGTQIAPTIATYELHYGKGKVITLGL